MAKFLPVGTIRKAKESGREYLCINQVTNASGEYHADNLKALNKALVAFVKDPTKEGIRLQLQSPAEKFDNLVKYNQITEDEAEARKAKVPTYIVKEVNLVLED